MAPLGRSTAPSSPNPRVCAERKIARGAKEHSGTSNIHGMMQDLDKIHDQKSVATDTKKFTDSSEAKHIAVSHPDPFFSSQRREVDGETSKEGDKVDLGQSSSGIKTKQNETPERGAQQGEVHRKEGATTNATMPEMPHHFIVWSETELFLLGPENEDECPTELVDQCVREGRLTGTLTSWDKVNRLSPLKGDHGHSHAYERSQVESFGVQRESPRHIPINVSSTSKISQDSFGLGKSSSNDRVSNESNPSTIRRLFKRQDTSASGETTEPTSPTSPLAILYDDFPTSPSVDRAQRRLKYSNKFSPRELFGTFSRSKSDTKSTTTDFSNDREPARLSNQSPLTKFMPVTPSEDASTTASALAGLSKSAGPSSLTPSEKIQSSHHHIYGTGRKTSNVGSDAQITPWESADDHEISTFVTSSETSASRFGYSCEITANVPPKPKSRFFPKVSLRSSGRRGSDNHPIPKYRPMPMISSPIEPIQIAGIPPFSGPVSPPDLQAPRMSKEYEAQPNIPLSRIRTVQSPDQTLSSSQKSPTTRQDVEQVARIPVGSMSAPLTQTKSTFSPRSVHESVPYYSPPLRQIQYGSQSSEPMSHPQLYSAPASSSQALHGFVENVPAVKSTRAPPTPSVRTTKSQASLRTMRSHAGSFNMTSPGLPPGPEHEGWADAVKYVKGQVAAEKEKAKRAKNKTAKTAEEIEQAEREAKIKSGIQMLKRSSTLGWVPRKPYHKLTEKDDEAIGMALEHMRAEKSAGLDGMFKFVGVDQAKEQVIAAARVMAPEHPAPSTSVRGEHLFENALNVLERSHQQQFFPEDLRSENISSSMTSSKTGHGDHQAHSMFRGERGFNQRQPGRGDPLGLAITGLGSTSENFPSSSSPSFVEPMRSARPVPLIPSRTAVEGRRTASQNTISNPKDGGIALAANRLRAAKSFESLAGSTTSLSRSDGSFRRKLDEIKQSRLDELNGQTHPANRAGPTDSMPTHPALQTQASEPRLRIRAHETEEYIVPPVPTIPLRYTPRLTPRTSPGPAPQHAPQHAPQPGPQSGPQFSPQPAPRPSPRPVQHRRHRAQTNILPTLRDRIDEEIEGWEAFSSPRQDS